MTGICGCVEAAGAEDLRDAGGPEREHGEAGPAHCGAAHRSHQPEGQRKQTGHTTSTNFHRVAKKSSF